MRRTTEIIERARSHVYPIYEDSGLEFHGLDHIQNVERAALKLCSLLGVETESERVEELHLAVLFHDLGYAENPATHERLSAEAAREFLRSQGFAEDRITRVMNLIYMTEYGKKPRGVWNKIIKDADTAHLGMDSYSLFAERLRKEKEKLKGIKISEIDWVNENIAFLEQHEYYTESAQKLYQPAKWVQLQKLKAIRRQNKAKSIDGPPDRGVETMYRVALRNHNQMSQIADNKANMILSINAIMLSLILSTLIPKIDNNEYLLLPTIVLILVSLVTIYFAVIAARPNVSSGNYSREALKSNKINILFFGNFFKLPLDEFEWGVDQLRNDRDLLYGSLTKDLYFLGLVLAKKYTALRTAFNVFLYGLIVASLSFVVALLF